MQNFDSVSDANRSLSTWLLTLGGLLIAYGLPQMGLFHWLAPESDIGARLVREAIWWAMAALLIAYVVFVEQKPLLSIGLRPPTRATYLYGVLAAVVLFASVVLCYSVLFPLLGLKMNQQAVGQITANPLWLQVMIVARAGVVEEILYRGYPIERIEELSGSKWLAAGVSAVVFTLVHLSFWGGAQLLVVGFGAVILALFYLWRRDLVANMLAHFLVDLVGFLAAGAHR